MCVISPSIVAAEEVELGQIVVTATRTESAIDSIPSSVTVITSDEIERKEAVTVVEILRDVPGLDVVQSGGPGGNSSVYIRGGESGSTLIMIDGVQVNSPTTGSYNLGELMSDNIERIEIIRGPQSTLYGSDAMTGVINIITKKGKGPLKWELSGESGSFNSRKYSLSLSGGMEKTNYSLSLSRFDTDGISTFKGGAEEDGYENTSISGRMWINPFGSVVLDLGLRYSHGKKDMDFYYNPVTFLTTKDAKNYLLETKSLTPYAKVTHAVNSAWIQTLTLSLDDTSTIEKKDSITTSEIDTEMENINWQHNLYLGDGTNTLTFGFEYEKQSGKNGSDGDFDKSINNRGFYLQDHISLANGKLNLIPGLRVDNHSKFGDETTSKLAVSYNFIKTDTRLKGNWGTGFKAPTLNDLYFDASWGVGNPDLKPEKSVGYDLAIEQKFGDSSFFSAVYFQNEFEELIQWDWSVFPMTPKNVAEAESSGWEFNFKFEPLKHIDLNASYTITETENKITGKELARRPKDKASLSMSWTPENAKVALMINSVGKRWNNSGNTDRLDSYTRVDMALSYDITSNLSIFGRGENLLNEDYEEVKDYGTPGVSYFGGLKANF